LFFHQKNARGIAWQIKMSSNNILSALSCNDLARNFYCATFFGQIFNQNNLRFIEARILRKEYFNRSRICFLDFKITFNLEKYFWELILVWKSILIFKINNFSLKIYQVEHKLLSNSCPQSRLFYLIKI
jgi:hypothetical protein